MPLRALRLLHGRESLLRFSWGTFVASANTFREKPIVFAYKSDSKPNDNCVAWLKSNPTILEWVRSPQCLRSPPLWPRGILPAFKHRLIPTPFDICNTDMQIKVQNTSEEYSQYLKLILYCMGFSLGQLSALLEESERDIERDMYFAVELLFSKPQFILWASATHFSRSLLPPHLSHLTLKEKGETVKKLRKNPFLLSDKEARPFLDSPRYLTYLVYGSPKKPRVTKDCRLYYTKEG